jgi:molybdopterin-binding protein
MARGFTRREVCARLGVSEKSLYTWEKAGRIPRPRRDYRGWRTYSAADVAAIRRVLGPDEASRAPRAADALEGLTARNRLAGVVRSIRADGILSEVVLALGDGQEVVAVVTTASVRRLGLRAGAPATAVIKSTEVMLFR